MLLGHGARWRIPRGFRALRLGLRFQAEGPRSRRLQTARAFGHTRSGDSGGRWATAAADEHSEHARRRSSRRRQPLLPTGTPRGGPDYRPVFARRNDTLQDRTHPLGTLAAGETRSTSPPVRSAGRGLHPTGLAPSPTPGRRPSRARGSTRTTPDERWPVSPSCAPG